MMGGDPFKAGDGSALERALRDRPGRPEPADALCERVLAGVERALSDPVVIRTARWRLGIDAAAWAAVVLIGLALSHVASSETAFFDRPFATAPSASSVRDASDLLQRVAPGLPPDDADRMAIAWAGRVNPMPMPVIGADDASRSLSTEVHSVIEGDLR